MAGVTRVAALFMALLCAACDVRLPDGSRVKSGDRISVTVMCPGSAAFDGWYDTKNMPGLTDASGRRIANWSRCAWIRRDDATPAQDGKGE